MGQEPPKRRISPLLSFLQVVAALFRRSCSESLHARARQTVGNPHPVLESFSLKPSHLCVCARQSGPEENRAEWHVKCTTSKTCVCEQAALKKLARGVSDGMVLGGYLALATQYSHCGTWLVRGPHFFWPKSKCAGYTVSAVGAAGQSSLPMHVCSWVPPNGSS